MKTDIFLEAINHRHRLKFLYNFSEITLEPYFISNNRFGKKVVFGRVNNSSNIGMFEYDKILNIKKLAYGHFSPIIPIMPSYN